MVRGVLVVAGGLSRDDGRPTDACECSSGKDAVQSTEYSLAVALGDPASRAIHLETKTGHTVNSFWYFGKTIYKVDFRNLRRLIFFRKVYVHVLFCFPINPMYR